MKRKTIICYVLLSLLVIIAAAGLYIYMEFNRTHKDTGDLKADYTLAATSLIREFESDEQISNKKYWDKVIRVEGIVKEIASNEKGLSDIVLGDTSSMSSVRCSIDSLHACESSFVKKGDMIVVKGICTGFNTDELLGSDVILVRSVIDKRN